jgi:peptidoglycan/xylan/chitin deacetylase (PgdA/CDA1 family)
VKLIIAAAVSTAVLIALGFFMISPMFYRTPNVEAEQKIMLMFSVSDANESAEWCQNLSSVLRAYDVSATVFIVGKVAEQYPECVSCFSSKVDIGSQTFSNLNLTSLPDYDAQLEEVRKGKLAVDAAGNLYSRVFMAPNGDTDQNIYSLLTRSDIIADFSYMKQYNVYQNGQFIKYDAAVYTADSTPDLAKRVEPIIILFNNTSPVSQIDSFLSKLDVSNIKFVSASELTGFNLTIRGD